MMKYNLIAFVVLIVGFFAITVVSCGENDNNNDMMKNDSKTESKTDKTDMGMKHENMNHNEMKNDEIKKDEMNNEDKEMIIVSTCPVMDSKANLDGKYIDNEDYRVYFCCDGCDDEFAKDPEKYIKKIKANPDKYIAK